ncbi:MAG: hypothetical protein K2Q03_03685 [Sphingobacteriaceae bacterium]|nr:hypothetical protein [Sphingobacteriaceae bacterium]
MKLSEVKEKLKSIENMSFELENGQRIPNHFHITEIGLITKNFIDCGGTLRNETNINFQLWEANDFDHRLTPTKLLSIIELAEKQLPLGNFDVEAEYQSTTIGKYDLSFKDGKFILLNKKTDCLAQDSCGIPQEKLNTCTPGGGCC